MGRDIAEAQTPRRRRVVSMRFLKRGKRLSVTLCPMAILRQHLPRIMARAEKQRPEQILMSHRKIRLKTQRFAVMAERFVGLALRETYLALLRQNLGKVCRRPRVRRIRGQNVPIT